MPRAMLAVACANVRASHARQVKDDVGLVDNKGKTKYLIAANTQNCSKACAVEIGRYNFERAGSFTCLSSLVTGNNKASEESTNCLITANRSYFGLRSQHKKQLLSRKTKISMYKKHLCGYPTETWTMTKNDDRRLSISGRKIFHRIYCPIYETEQWQKRCNREIEELYNEPNIVNIIKPSRLRWAGHVERMDENEYPIR